MKWFKEEFTPTVAQRGGALIKKWGRSSAASTAVSIADAIRSLVVPTAPGDCFSSAVCTDGNAYGIEEGLIFSMPCRWVGAGPGSVGACDWGEGCSRQRGHHGRGGATGSGGIVVHLGEFGLNTARRAETTLLKVGHCSCSARSRLEFAVPSREPNQTTRHLTRSVSCMVCVLSTRVCAQVQG